MNWADTATMARGLAAAALISGSGGAAMAGPVVVRSTGPSAKTYPVGRLLPDTSQLVLKAGDSIVLLDARGTRTVNGPGSFAAVATSARVTTAGTAGRILANQTSSERRGGAVRGGTPTVAAQSPNLWFVDPTRSGTLCLADTNAVTLWRGSAEKDATVRISSASGSDDVLMARGATMAAWPKSVPVVNGGEYTISVDGLAPATKVKVVAVSMPASVEDTAAQLIAKGCKQQLDLLIASSPKADPAG